MIGIDDLQAGDVILTTPRRYKWWDIPGRLLTFLIRRYNKKLIPKDPHSLPIAHAMTHAILVVGRFGGKPPLIFQTTFSLLRPSARFDVLDEAGFEELVKRNSVAIMRNRSFPKLLIKDGTVALGLLYNAVPFDGYIYDIGQLVDLEISQKRRARKIFDFSDKALVCSALVRAVLEKTLGRNVLRDNSLDIDTTPPAAFCPANGWGYEHVFIGL